MIRVLVLALVICAAPTFAWATAANNFSDTPRCVMIHNDAGVETLVHTETPYFTDKNGKLNQYNQTFKLAPDGQQEVCTTGPFFDNYAIRVVVKTSIPLYSCKVPLPMEEIVVNVLRRPGSDDPNDLIMDCLEEGAAGSK